MTDDTLRVIVGLHAELARRAREAIATPEEARRANTELRQLMRTKNNYLPDIDALAQELVTQGRLLARRADAPRGLADGRAARLRARARARPAALGTVGDRPRERADLPAAGIHPGRPRHSLDGAAGDGASPA